MIVFVSSFISPHTLPLCTALAHRGEDVRFIALMPITEERKKLGYQQEIDTVQVISYAEQPQVCKQLILNAEVVVFSHFKMELIEERCSKGKLTFIYSERLLKKGILKFLDGRLYKQWFFHVRYRNAPVYLLAIGKKSATDFKMLGFNPHKIFSFAYFPEVLTYPVQERIRKNKQIELIWVGRLVGFKRIMWALKAVKSCVCAGGGYSYDACW